MFDATRLLGALLGSGALRGGKKKWRNKHGHHGHGGSPLGGLLGGGLGGGLGSAGKVALGMGALGVAMAAFEHFMQQRQGAPGAPAASPPPPPPPAAGPVPPPPPPAPAAAPATAPAERDSLLLVRAMIAAAYADGQLDADERAAIVRSLDDAGLGADDRAAIASELLSPVPVDTLVRQVDRTELAEAFFAATLLTLEVDTDAERQYVDRLVAQLGLTAEQVARLREVTGKQ